MRFKATLSSVLLFYLLDPVVSNPQLNKNGFVESRLSSAQNVTYIPNTYIVELEHTPSTKAASLFSQRLGGRVKYHVRKEFNNAQLFYGLSLTVTDGISQKSDLLEISGVKKSGQLDLCRAQKHSWPLCQTYRAIILFHTLEVTPTLTDHSKWLGWISCMSRESRAKV